jgi:hypothetical protein
MLGPITSRNTSKRKRLQTHRLYQALASDIHITLNLRKIKRDLAHAAEYIKKIHQQAETLI